MIDIKPIQDEKINFVLLPDFLDKKTYEIAMAHGLGYFHGKLKEKYSKYNDFRISLVSGGQDKGKYLVFGIEKEK